MAIVDQKASQWYLVDRDEDQYIGLKWPFVLDNGNLASTKTTLNAVKQNLFSLCSTEQGERVMQPNLGVALKRFLFQPFEESMVDEIKIVITESINYWMPFVLINLIEIDMHPSERGDFRNTMNIKIRFALKQDPNTHESIQVEVGSGGEGDTTDS